MDPKFHTELPVSITVEDDEIVKADDDDDDELPASSSDSCFGFELVQRIEEGSKDYEIVKRSFVGGSNDYEKKVEIAGIHKKNYGWSVMDDARLEVFRLFAAAVACRNGGDANIKYGWFGGSRDEIQEILLYGFRRFENRCSSYGRGLYLSPASIPLDSIETSVPDSNGMRHVLLCRVILGRPETTYFGSQMVRPSAIEFDSGVDNLSSPTKYVIWEPYMNTHILPVFIISFQVNSSIGAQSRRIPTSPHMTINGLINHLTNYLSSSKIALVRKLHHEYHKNKISRFAFIRSLRAIVGDDLLRVVVQGLR